MTEPSKKLLALGADLEEKAARYREFQKLFSFVMKGDEKVRHDLAVERAKIAYEHALRDYRAALMDEAKRGIETSRPKTRP